MSNTINIFAITVFLLMIATFQNCAPMRTFVENSGSKTTQLSSTNGITANPDQNYPLGTGKSGLSIKLLDATIGDGVIIHRISQKIYGVGSSNLLACSLPANSVSGCDKPEHFQLLIDQAGWSYDSAKDLYSINKDVVANGYPFSNYKSRFIISGESQTPVEVMVVPIKAINESTSNGSVITLHKESITGLGENVMACTGPVSQKPCETWVPLSSAQYWSYDTAKDVYSINTNQHTFPHQEYLSRYRLANGMETSIRIFPKAIAPVCDWTHFGIGGSAPSRVATPCNPSRVGQSAEDNNGITQRCYCR